MTAIPSGRRYASLPVVMMAASRRLSPMVSWSHLRCQVSLSLMVAESRCIVPGQRSRTSYRVRTPPAHDRPTWGVRGWRSRPVPISAISAGSRRCLCGTTRFRLARCRSSCRRRWLSNMWGRPRRRGARFVGSGRRAWI